MRKRVIPALATFLVMAGALAYAYRAARVQHKPAQHGRRTSMQARGTHAIDTPVTATLARGTPTSGVPGRPTLLASEMMPAAPFSVTATATVSATPTPAQLSAARFSLFTVNPLFTPQRVSFTLFTPAHVRVRIAPEGQVRPVRTRNLGARPAGTVHISWNGRDNAGKLVPTGTYKYTITAVGTG